MKEEYVRQSHMFGSFLEDYPEEKQNILNKLNVTKKRKTYYKQADR